MTRAFFLIVICSMLGACTQRMVCPAFQSAYIYDKNELRKKFSYFKEDSTPKILTASKTRFLVAEPTTYRRKVRSIESVAMKPIKTIVPDSLRMGEEMDEEGLVSGAELDLAARSVIDSTYIVDVPRDSSQQIKDSVYVISKDREVRVLKYNFPDSLVYDAGTGKYKSETPSYSVTEVRFNVDQDNYMWYLRDYLVLPDVRLAKLNQSDGGTGVTDKKEKRGQRGFFKNLFKKKEEPVDSADLPLTPKKEFDYIEEDGEIEADTIDVDQTDTTPDMLKPKSSSNGVQKPMAEEQSRKDKKKSRRQKKKEAVEPKKQKATDDDDGF